MELEKLQVVVFSQFIELLIQMLAVVEINPEFCGLLDDLRDRETGIIAIVSKLFG